MLHKTLDFVSENKQGFRHVKRLKFKSFQMQCKKFCDSLQCAKDLLESPCAVYFSAVTNI